MKGESRVRQGGHSGIDVPDSGEFVIQARGHDIFGQVSEPVSATVTGSAYDPAPLSLRGGIEEVEVSMDGGPWRVVPEPYVTVGVLPRLGAERLWRYSRA